MENKKTQSKLPASQQKQQQPFKQQQPQQQQGNKNPAQPKKPGSNW